MADKDIVSKTLLKRLVIDLAHYLFGLDLSEVEVLDTEYQRIEDRRADLLVRARSDTEFLLHIEIQKEEEAMLRVDVKELPSYELGWEKGLEDGHSKGLGEGRQKGRQEGRQEGRYLEREAIALRLLKVLPAESVAEHTGLPLKAVRRLAED